MRFIFVILSLVTVVACETVEGFGQDLSNAGDEISQEAREAQ
ncbi:entericidin A/B family lipoprotein [Cognatishimia maritima]|uniref:Predicted small secreted protein n=1 Tax=Cognatishimia maritima TaxID=870908 RepID=A0A1M5PJ99_9RHOB|nr:entericidin A/B family lipoprotein [Cognatishimia maritima]SHH01906.1 Predicted small secreted protein [Cognatishimia maritima]